MIHFHVLSVCDLNLNFNMMNVNLHWSAYLAFNI